MLNLRYINKTTNTLLDLGNEAPVFFLSQKGMDKSEVDTFLVKSPLQLGKTHVSTTVNERIITINACLVTDSISEQELFRKKIISTLNPLHLGDLVVLGDTFQKRFPSVIVVDGPVFNDTDYNTPDGILYFNFSLCVPSAFIEDLNTYSYSLCEVVPMFSFQLMFENTIIFGDISSGTLLLNNNGDIEAPIIIEIPGPVETPMLTNLTTGEFIKIYSPIQANEKMIINTAFGNKSVQIIDDNGNSINAFNYIDLNSTFFQLPVGENVLQFQAEVGNNNASINVSFKTLYLGI